MTTLTAPRRAAGQLQPRLLLAMGLVLGLGLLVLAMLASIVFGAADIDFATVWAALFHFNPDSTSHLIIRTLRIPRALVAACVGGALAVAGAMMQGLTRNPLADPGLLGIEAGAALGVVSGVTLLHISSLGSYALFAFVGAAVSAVCVYTIGSFGRGGATPLKLTIAGASISALLSSLTTGFLILNQQTLEEVRFWLSGSVAGRDLNMLATLAPYFLVGFVIALALGRQITALSLGDDVARGLGQRTGWVKALASVAVVLLAGSSVALAGPIGFVGLVIPHMVRMFVGIDYRWVLPYSILCGGIFLIIADIAARMVIRPIELPVGIATAIIGGPVFIYLVRWRVKR
ncbi:iron ABC transporter permease [Chloroflexia bacterium SDU3-3]|nr:iron ABC transporter permease [Chloroflexia bacterium SDU3-3]